ncbi:MAG: type II toxin-antitoxin system prevent-host-death family antitoxin [Actinomycetota bacterium]
MRIATITEAKNKLSALLDIVKAGETVVIVDRGIPVARLEPAQRSHDDEGRLARLERAGIIRRGTGRYPKWLLETPPPKGKPGVSAVEFLLEERREGR